jgi:hypothetical protein
MAMRVHRSVIVNPPLNNLDDAESPRWLLQALPILAHHVLQLPQERRSRCDDGAWAQAPGSAPRLIGPRSRSTESAVV